MKDSKDLLSYDAQMAIAVIVFLGFVFSCTLIGIIAVRGG
jgi:hypothetical protein